MITFKKTFYLLVSILIIGLIGVTESVYASSTSITGDKTINVGESVTITGSVTSGAWALTLSGGGQNKQIVGNTETTGNASDSGSITFTPSSAGTYTFTLTGNETDYDTEEEKSVNKTCTITVKEAPKQENENNSGSGNSSSTPQPPIELPETPKTVESRPVEVDNRSRNNYLKSLSVNVGTLTPEFLPDTSEYELKFEEGFNLRSLKNIEISADAEDENASVDGTGTRELENGDNYFEISVRAENGNYRTYKIKVSMPEKIQENELRLKSLKLYYKNSNGDRIPITYSKGFNSNTMQYIMELPSYAKSVIVETEMDNNEIIIEIEGNENLKVGENIIKVILTSPDDENVKAEYIIVANVAETTITETGIEDINYNKTNKKILLISTIAYNTLTVLLIGVLITMYTKQNNKKVEETFENYSDDNTENFSKNINDEEIKHETKKESIFIDYSEEETEEKDKKYKGRRFE